MFGTLIFGFFAVVLWVAGGVLLYFRYRTQQKVGLMRRTETSSAADVSALAPGTLVEIQGTLRCDSPLTSEMSGRICAYYSARVVREYLERDRDDDNRPGSNRRSETLAHNEQLVQFTVEDGTGSVLVQPDGADMDAYKVVDRFERNTDGEGSSISFAGATLQLGGGEHTIGYRYTESILPVDGPVYVLGVVREYSEIGAPQLESREQRFIISYRSEEALKQNLGKSAFWLGLIALSLFVFGAVFAAVSIASALGYIEFR
jgi:hypothetical protein